MGQGRIYVQVMADAINGGIMTLDGSNGGGSQGSYWLLWDSNGYQSLGWYWTETPITSWWNSHYNDPQIVGEGADYSNDAEGLSDWIKEHEITNLDGALSSWDNSDKWDFIVKHSLYGCMNA